MQIRSGRIRINSSLFPEYFFLRRRSPLFVTRYRNNASTLVLLTFLFVCNPSSQLFVSNVHYFRSIRHIPFLLSSICQRKVHIMHSDLYFSFAFQTVFLLFSPVFLSCLFNHSFSKEKCTISCIPMHPYSLFSSLRSKLSSSGIFTFNFTFIFTFTFLIICLFNR